MVQQLSVWETSAPTVHFTRAAVKQRLLRGEDWLELQETSRGWGGSNVGLTRVLGGAKNNNGNVTHFVSFRNVAMLLLSLAVSPLGMGVSAFALIFDLARHEAQDQSVP